jgi:hypothetical protein
LENIVVRNGEEQWLIIKVKGLLFIIAIIWESREGSVSLIVSKKVAFETASVGVDVRGRKSIVEVEACHLVWNRLEKEENCVHDLPELVSRYAQNPFACQVASCEHERHIPV